MRPAALTALLLLAAGAVLWLVLGGPGDASREGTVPEAATHAAPRGGGAGPEASGPLGVPGPPPAEAEPEDPDWITAPLPLRSGRGPLTGEELLAAVDAAGKIRIRGATEEDLAALRRATFPEVPREVDHPHAALGAWLREAGFDAQMRYPTLVVRRRAEDPETER